MPDPDQENPLWEENYPAFESGRHEKRIQKLDNFSQSS